jgi:hypothetical protein
MLPFSYEPSPVYKTLSIISTHASPGSLNFSCSLQALNPKLLRFQVCQTTGDTMSAMQDLTTTSGAHFAQSEDTTASMTPSNMDWWDQFIDHGALHSPSTAISDNGTFGFGCKTDDNILEAPTHKPHARNLEGEDATALPNLRTTANSLNPCLAISTGTLTPGSHYMASDAGSNGEAVTWSRFGSASGDRAFPESG